MKTLIIVQAEKLADLEAWCEWEAGFAPYLAIAWCGVGVATEALLDAVGRTDVPIRMAHDDSPGFRGAWRAFETEIPDYDALLFLDARSRGIALDWFARIEGALQESTRVLITFGGAHAVAGTVAAFDLTRRISGMRDPFPEYFGKREDFNAAYVQQLERLARRAGVEVVQAAEAGCDYLTTPVDEWAIKYEHAPR